MASSFQYGDFTLDSSNFINVNVVREKSPREHSLGLLQPARSRGMSLVSITPKAKIIEIEGTISTQSANQTYSNAIRDFNAVFTKQADFQVGTVDGLFLYEGCVAINPESMLRQEQHWNQNFIPFRVELLAPKGLAISTDLTTNKFNNISSSPYTNDVDIGGSLAAEPTITLTLDSTGGNNISQLTFLNRDTNESISVSTTYASDDVVQINTRKKEVLYNTQPKRFSGLLPRFKLDENSFKIDVESSDTVAISQTTSDTNRSVFGNNYLAQQINPDSNLNVPQIDLLMKRVEELIFNLETYDTFNDNNFDTSLWTEVEGNGDISETNNRLELTSTAPDSIKVESVDTDFNGVKFQFGRISGVNGSSTTNHFVELVGGGTTINVWLPATLNQTTIRVNGSDVKTISGTNHTWDFKPVGSDIQILSDGSLQHTVVGASFSDSGQITYRNASASDISKTFIDNVQKYVSSNATNNEDLTVELQTDSSGKPSGTAVTNGTGTVKASNVATDSFSIIPVSFTTEPSLSSATDYHIVVKQTGGDVNNFYSVKLNTEGGYSQGNVETSSDGGTSWTERSAEDLWMKVYNTFPTGFDLDAEINYRITHHSVV